MNNFTTNIYEMKRDLINYSKKISVGLNKSSSKFVMDMIYGIARSNSCLISKISRSLFENIKLRYTIERLCDNLQNMSNDEVNIIMSNYYNEIKDSFADDAIAIFDDSDIAKRYGKKFEDLDRIIDAVRNITNRKTNMIFDRGYDNNKIIDYVDRNNDCFVIRLDDKRNLLFKGKKQNAYSVAVKRKGKIRMCLLFDDNEEHIVYVSHTRATLPYNKKEYQMVTVYGLSEERPLILLTNREIKSKEDVIKVVRLYFYRWRVEEYFRSKKQEYEFENMRVRTLKSMNVLNKILTILMGHISILAEEIDRKLLSIKIIERSKSLREKILIWLSQISRGIEKILSYAQSGIKEWQKIEVREKYKQLSLL